MTSDKAVSAHQRIDKMFTGKPWQSVGLQGGWNGTLHFRYGVDFRHVVLKMTGANPNGNTGGSSGGVGGAAGIDIASLPNAYAPQNPTDIALSVDTVGESVPYQSAHVHISPSGNVRAYGISTLAHNVSLHAHLAIADDP